MGATAFLTLFSAIFLAFAQASKLDHLAPIARDLDCHNGTGYGCQENYVDAHLKRAVDADERLKPLIDSLDLFPRSSGLEKRDGIRIKKDLEFNPFNGDSKSHFGFVSVDDITGIQTGDGGASTRTLVKDLATYGYIDLTCDPDNDSPNLVAALYVPKLGVFVGSIPRSKGTASKLFEMAQKYPDYAKLLSYRLGGTSPDQMDYEQFHAEDMVISNAVSKLAESMDAEEMEGMLRSSKVAIWGKYNKTDKEGHKAPCGTTGDSKMNPSCLTVLQQLGIKHV